MLQLHAREEDVLEQVENADEERGAAGKVLQFGGLKWRIKVLQFAGGGSKCYNLEALSVTIWRIKALQFFIGGRNCYKVSSHEQIATAPPPSLVVRQRSDDEPGVDRARARVVSAAQSVTIHNRKPLTIHNRKPLS